MPSCSGPLCCSTPGLITALMPAPFSFTPTVFHPSPPLPPTNIFLHLLLQLQPPSFLFITSRTQVPKNFTMSAFDRDPWIFHRYNNLSILININLYSLGKSESTFTSTRTLANPSLICSSVTESAKRGFRIALAT